MVAGRSAPLQREGCERPLMSDRLDLANYLPYLVNRSVGAGGKLHRVGARQHDLNIDAWRVMAVLANQGAQRQIDLAA